MVAVVVGKAVGFSWSVIEDVEVLFLCRGLGIY